MQIGSHHSPLIIFVLQSLPVAWHLCAVFRYDAEARLRCPSVRDHSVLPSQQQRLRGGAPVRRASQGERVDSEGEWVGLGRLAGGPRKVSLWTRKVSGWTRKVRGWGSEGEWLGLGR